MANTDQGTAAVKAETAPAPDDPRKPDAPPDLSKRSWKYTGRMAFGEFKRDECTDLAATLTYFAVLSAFPAFIVIASLVGVIGQPQKTADAVLKLITDLGHRGAADQLRGTVEQLTRSRGAGLALVLGALLALWSASAFVAAFGRSMNRIYEVDEGRPFWKLRLVNLGVSLVLIIGASVMLLGVTMSGGLARQIGDRLGLSDAAVTFWNIIKWPIMLVVMALMVAVLYYATPNVRQPKFRWMSVGSGLAILLWIIGSVGFGFYVSNFGNYDKTYGSLAGVIVILLWLWITNCALLFGAEFDAELERARELQAGIEAEETLQLPPRDTKKSDKKAEKVREDVEEGRALRESENESRTSTASR
jgi:membrane protein